MVGLYLEEEAAARAVPSSEVVASATITAGILDECAVSSEMARW